MCYLAQPASAGISSQVFPHLSPSRASVGRISIGCFCQLDITLLHIRQIVFSCKNSSSNLIRFSLQVTTWDFSAKLVPYLGEMKFEYLGVPSMERLSFPVLVWLLVIVTCREEGRIVGRPKKITGCKNYWYIILTKFNFLCKVAFRARRGNFVAKWDKWAESAINYFANFFA